MNDRRGGLGRGLGALLPSGPRRTEERPADVFFDRGAERMAPAYPSVEVPRGADVPRGTPDGGALDPATPAGVRFAELPVAAISPNPRQPRQVFDEDALAELVASIREVGLLQPIVVREAGPDAYEIVMGERRWRASREAGLETIPAVVRTTGDDALLRDALLENLHRSDLNPLEEAAAYEQLLQDFGCTHEELAARIGRSRPQVSNTLRLLKLPPVVQRRVAAGVLSAGHARALLGLTEPSAQEHLAQRIVAEGLSVRMTEEVVALGGPEAGAGGGADGADRRSRGPRLRPVRPELDELAAALSDRFDTRVRVDLGRRKGRLVMEFATVEDLERIVALFDAASGNGSVGAGAAAERGADEQEPAALSG